MVELYNARVTNQGISPEEMRAVCVDIVQDRGKIEYEEISGVEFDVVVVSSDLVFLCASILYRKSLMLCDSVCSHTITSYL